MTYFLNSPDQCMTRLNKIELKRGQKPTLTPLLAAQNINYDVHDQANPSLESPRQDSNLMKIAFAT